MNDSRVLVGTFMAFDRHMNIVLGDTEEYRKIKAKKGSGITEEREEKRVLGLIILRGDSVVSLTIEGPPPPELNEKLTPGGPGVSKLSAGRGVPVMNNAPAGLGGPVRGVGGPGLSIMQPPTQVAAQMQAQQFPPRPLPGSIPPRPLPGMGMGMPPPGMMGMGMPPPPGMIGMPPPGMMPRGPPGMGMPPRAPPGMPPRGF